jgi:hypothetical protein
MVVAPKSRKTAEAANEQAKSTQFNTNEVVSQIENAPKEWAIWNPVSWFNDREIDLDSPTYGKVNFKWKDDKTAIFTDAKGSSREISKSDLPKYVRMLGLDSQQIPSNEYVYDGDTYTMDELTSVLTAEQINKFIKGGTIKPK